MPQPPPNKSQLLNVSNYSNPAALQAALDAAGDAGYVGPYVNFTMNGVQFIYVGGYAPTT